VQIKCEKKLAGILQACRGGNGKSEIRTAHIILKERPVNHCSPSHRQNWKSIDCSPCPRKPFNPRN